MSRPHPALRHLRGPLIALLSASLLLAACGEEDQPAAPAGGEAPVTTSASESPDATTPAASPPAGTPATTESTAATGAVDEVPLHAPALFRDDVDCSLDFVASGGGDEFPDAFTAAHFVVGGILGATCLGTDDERLIDAWRWLRVAAPAEELERLVLFAGFDFDTDTLAYVEPLLGADGRLAYQMTVNLQAAEADEIELILTMAHEFTHVMAATEAHLDETVDFAECDTYHNGDGCFREDSYIGRWVAAFWGDWIDDLTPDNKEDADAADARCIVDDSFIGAYAATNPEEDFAETFSAYVYSVPVDSPGLLTKYDFFEADPSLRQYRDRVLAQGFEPLPNQFDGCGF